MLVLWRLGVLLLLSTVHVTQSSAQPLERLAFGDLAGWRSDDLDQALGAFRRSCEEIRSAGKAFGRPVRFGGTRDHWLGVCDVASSAQDGRAFFETAFLPFKVNDPVDPNGLFTGYFEPEVSGSRNKGRGFEVPIYRKPDDLVRFGSPISGSNSQSYGRFVGGKIQPYFTRREIETGALAGRGLEIVWLRDWADAFFIQVQGSGRVRLDEGDVIRLGYAAKSGRPYTSIGGLLAARGIISREELSMQTIRQWMAENPRAARKLMWENESFVFFRELELQAPSLGPIGAQYIQLTPQRSIAVDRDFWMFGTPMWIDTTVPDGADKWKRFRKLLIAQDTGSAIRGMARGDIFWGVGERAARTAGPMKSPGTMVVLLPVMVAKDMGLLP